LQALTALKTLPQSPGTFEAIVTKFREVWSFLALQVKQCLRSDDLEPFLEEKKIIEWLLYLQYFQTITFLYPYSMTLQEPSPSYPSKRPDRAARLTQGLGEIPLAWRDVTWRRT